jgi:hypothetical protein
VLAALLQRNHRLIREPTPSWVNGTGASPTTRQETSQRGDSRERVICAAGPFQRVDWCGHDLSDGADAARR